MTGLRTRFWIGAGAFLLLLLLSLGLERLAWWQGIERQGYDVLTRLSAPPGQTLPISIVAIDDVSLEALNRRWPWPRDVHARLIERINALGATLIVFDVVFAARSLPEEDAALTAAIASAGNVVLAAERVREESAHGTLLKRLDPMPDFLAAGAVSGLANVDLDRDLVMRALPAHPESLWRVARERLAGMAPLGTLPEFPAGTLIRYLGPSPVFPVISAASLLDPGSALPADAFAGQVIYVGRISHGILDLGTEVDLFSTPYTAVNGRQTPGVEMQATFLENGIRDLPIALVTENTRFLLIVLAATLATLSLRWRFAYCLASGLLQIGALAGLAFHLFVSQGVWLPVLAPAAASVLAILMRLLATIITERQHKQAIKRMFSLYVPARVVDALVAQQTPLTLGGEARTISVLFCDLRGFTSLSEALEPQQLTRLLSLYLDTLSQIIFEHDGTIDKYIGDAIMAFWGAPLADPAHAAHALRAAQAMLNALPDLNRKLASEGLPAIDMRIGLNSGEAVVGNMGSSVRFSYTAVGDTVNLAARLEPLNKNYDTHLLFSQATLESAGLQAGNGPLGWISPVGEVTVRGRSGATPIYTLQTGVAEIAPAA